MPTKVPAALLVLSVVHLRPLGIHHDPDPALRKPILPGHRVQTRYARKWERKHLSQTERRRDSNANAGETAGSDAGSNQAYPGKVPADARQKKIDRTQEPCRMRL